MPNLGQYIKKQSKRDDRVGDLARDYIEDGCYKNCETYDSILRHLREAGACQGAIDALNQAQDEFNLAGSSGIDS